MLGDKETIEYIRLAKLGDNSAKEMLLEHNVSLVKCIVKRYLRRGVEYDDLFQIACIGFLKAIAGFDEGFNVKFSTYAVPMIAGEIKRFIRDNGIIKVSRSTKQLNMKINKFIENYNIPDTANYPYQVVLNTFKFCTPDIQKCLASNSFRDEMHKFNYVIKIVESNLNTVYIRMKNAKKAEEEVKNHDMSDAANYVNTFKVRDNDSKKSNKYDDLW